MGQRVLTDKNRNENRIGLHVSAQGRASTFYPAQLSATASCLESQHETTPERKVLALGVQKARLHYMESPVKVPWIPSTNPQVNVIQLKHH